MDVSGSKRFGFATTGLMLCALMIGTNIPSPLYGVYEHLWHFSPSVLTLVFSTYALCIIPSLLIFGQLSDALGRKPVMVAGFLIAAVGSLTFVFAKNVTWLFIARALQGLAVGIVSGTATAALTELEPNSNRQRASLVASLATAGGTALGPIFAGLLAQYAPMPLQLPYLLNCVLLLIGLLGLLFISEPLPKDFRKHWEPQRPGVPREILSPFVVGSLVAFAAWTVTALFMSLVPSYVTSLLHVKNLAVAGSIVFLMLGSSSLIQLTLRKLGNRTAQITGLLLLLIGLAGIIASVPMQSLWFLLVSTVIAGAGQGLAFMGSVSLVNHVAPPAQRGSVFSTMYVVVYCGVGLPVIGVGFLAQKLGLFSAVIVFSVLVCLLNLVMIGAILRLKEISK